MSIGSIKALGSIDPRSAYGAGNATAGATGSFATQLKNAIGDVQQLQVKREDMIEEMVTGKTTEVHDVMIAAKESQLAFELLMEVRNKLLESYQELMRMPV